MEIKPPCFILSVLLCLHLSHSLNSDGLSLLALKSAISHDPTGVLSNWSDSDPTPCYWSGVQCSLPPHPPRVISLSLSGFGLTGYLPSELGALLSLQHLSLSRNNFSKLIPPHLFNATSLISLDLSHNSLSGPLSPQIAALKTLVSLDLSSNLLNGSLPVELSELAQLAGTLNLSYNQFSGGVPPAYGRLPVMVSLDLRHNNLTGKIPQLGSLLNQGPTAFAGNPSLCGFPLSTPCPEAQNPNLPLNPYENSGIPNPSFPTSEDLKANDKSKRSTGTIPLMIAVFVAVGAVVISLWAAKRRWEGKTRREKEEEGRKETVVGGGGGGGEEGQKGKFAVIDEGFALELEDLLRASAYVVGKSKSGIMYKVVVGGVRGGGGTAVAVRRLSEGDDMGWRLREFESEVEAIGRVQHPNIVRLRAYYYASDEKLLISDFIRNGSLHSALHGAPSNESPPLSWAARLNIAQGAARGLAHIHECSPRKYVHGNLKSSKILLDDDLQPYISGFGLHRLLSPVPATHLGSTKRHHSHTLSFKGSEILSSSTATYMAPEARSGSKLTQKCDVYSFGIVLMEMLTGRLADGSPALEAAVREVFREQRPLSEIIDPALLHEVQAKKEVLAVFHVALSCTEAEAEVRPRMRVVCEKLEAIKCQQWEGV